MRGSGRARLFDGPPRWLFSACHGVAPVLQFINDAAGEAGRLTANAPAPHIMESKQQPVRTAA